MRSPSPVAVVVALLAASLALSCSKKKSEEDLVREVLDAAEAGAEAPKLRDVMDHVSDRFNDGSGADKDAIKGVLASQLLRGPVNVIRRNETIAVEGGTAKASFDALVTRGDPQTLGGAIPADAGAYRFDLELEKEDDGAWRVVGASYREIPAAQFFK